MKRIFCLALCMLMLFAFVSCGGDQPDETTGGTTVAIPAEIHCTVSVIGKDNKTLIDKCAITLRDRTTWPTVLEALSQACSAYDLKFAASEDGLGVESIDGLATTLGDDAYYWEWTLNGRAVTSGRAGNIEVTEGDAYVFTYTKYIAD